MEDKKKRSSNFAEPIGIALLGILGAVSCYFKIYTVGGTLFFFCLIFLFALLWGKYALAKLEVTVNHGEWRGFPGERICFSCRLKNKKLLPLLWLEAGFPAPENACFGENLKRKFLAIRWQEELIFDLEEAALRRGICLFSEMTAMSGDGFGLHVREEKLKLSYPVSVIVYPEIFPVQIEKILQSFSETQQGEKGYLEDVTLLKMNRSYEPQDPARKINWRTLAGQGRLTTNIYETMLPRIVTFALDLASFRKEEEDSEGRLVYKPLEKELEGMLSFVASCVAELTRNRVSCRIWLPSPQTDLELLHAHGDGAEGLLEQLASVDYDGSDRYFTSEDQENMNRRPGMQFLVTLDYSSFTGKEIFSMHQGSKQRVLAMKRSKADSESLWNLLYAEEFLTQEPAK